MELVPPTAAPAGCLGFGGTAAFQGLSWSAQGMLLAWVCTNYRSLSNLFEWKVSPWLRAGTSNRTSGVIRAAIKPPQLAKVRSGRYQQKKSVFGLLLHWQNEAEHIVSGPAILALLILTLLEWRFSKALKTRRYSLPVRRNLWFESRHLRNSYCQERKSPRGENEGTEEPGWPLGTSTQVAPC